MSTRHRTIDITRFVTAKDVQFALNCSPSTAYYHLRRAARRPRGERGMLRVPVLVWERYVAELFSGEPQEAPTRQPTRRKRRSAPTDPEVAELVPITRPRGGKGKRR